MNTQKSDRIIKHALYALILFIFHVLGSVPGLFVVAQVKPILTIPAAVAVAMVEDEFAGGIYGAFAGLLCDMSGSLLFGFNGFVVTICCVAAGLMVSNLMRCSGLTCVLFVFLTMLIRGSLEYFFSLGMWNYPGAGLVYTSYTLPTAIYSTAFAVPVFFLIRLINRRFSAGKEE